MPKNNPKISALVLFSGGLDSILAAKLLEKQNIKVTALVFESYFFDAEEAKKSAKKNNINLEIQDISRQHLEIVKNPEHGFGKAMNPCIDCHALMFAIARKKQKKEKFDILATGEVLGQRPFSQNKNALAQIEKITGLQKKVLRPLSAKLLPETVYEKTGVVKKQELENINGRSRKRQMELAKKFGIKYHPTPAGGCKLTEPEYSKKLQDLLELKEKPGKNDFELLQIGRHFWREVDGQPIQLIVGRNKNDTEKMHELSQKIDLIIEREDKKGPAVMIREAGNFDKKIQNEIIEIAKGYIGEYSKNFSESEVEIIAK